MNRLMLGSSNYAAAKIIIENFDANEVVTKAELQKKMGRIRHEQKVYSIWFGRDDEGGDLDISRRGEQMSVFARLSKIDVSKHIEKKAILVICHGRGRGEF